jgi:hypothetical protein
METILSARRLASVFVQGGGLAVPLVASALGLTLLLQNIISTAGVCIFLYRRRSERIRKTQPGYLSAFRSSREIRSESCVLLSRASLLWCGHEEKALVIKCGRSFRSLSFGPNG